jgi:hypothetical protein
MATADFYLKLVLATPAAIDQEHLRVLIWSDPTIPDRSEALLAHGADPTPALIAGAKLLEQSGAGMLAVPCNTAHAFLKSVQAEVGIPIIHMIEETANYVAALAPEVQCVGLLSTTGTQRAGLYQAWLEQKGITVLSPGAGSQENLVMPAIRAVRPDSRVSLLNPGSWWLPGNWLLRVPRRSSAVARRYPSDWRLGIWTCHSWILPGSLRTAWCSGPCTRSAEYSMQYATSPPKRSATSQAE